MVVILTLPVTMRRAELWMISSLFMDVALVFGNQIGAAKLNRESRSRISRLLILFLFVGPSLYRTVDVAGLALVSLF